VRDISAASAAPVTDSTRPATPSGARRFFDRVRLSSLAFDLALVGGVALILGLFRLGTPSVWVDEAFTAQAVRERFLNPIDQYHWLYYSIVTPWSFVAGTSEWALRMPSVFSAMLACALLVLLAHKLFDRRVAVASGLFLAASPFLVKWSQQARPYSMVLTAGILATLLLFRALERGSRGAWAGYGFAFSLVFAMHPVSALVLVPAHALLVLQRREKLFPHGFLAACVIVSLGAPWAFARARQTPGDNWLHRPSLGAALNTLLDVSGAAGLGLLLALVGLVVLRRAGRKDLALWLGAWAFAPFALALIVSFVTPIYLDRYLITAAPAFALLAGIAVFGVGARLGLALGLAAVIATSIGLANWYSQGSRGNWRGEDWRNAVTTVLARRAESDAVVVAPWWAEPAAAYYGASATGISSADSLWVVVWSESGHRLPESERRPLGFGDHRLVERLQFGRRVSAQLWERDP